MEKENKSLHFGVTDAKAVTDNRQKRRFGKKKENGLLFLAECSGIGGIPFGAKKDGYDVFFDDEEETHRAFVREAEAEFGKGVCYGFLAEGASYDRIDVVAGKEDDVEAAGFEPVDNFKDAFGFARAAWGAALVGMAPHPFV